MKTGLQDSSWLESKVQSYVPCYKANKSPVATVQLPDFIYFGKRELELQCINLEQGQQISSP